MWKPVDTEFYCPHVPVSLVMLSGTDALRGLLESLRCVVLTHRPGTPGDFLKVLSQGENAPRYMVICGHGTPEGIWFGQYGPPDIDTSMLRGAYLPPEIIRQHINLPGCTVIGAFCHAGDSNIGSAFAAGGLAGYIGSRPAISGVEMSVFLVNFFNNALHKKMSDRDAWRKAVEATDMERIWETTFFHPDGTEEALFYPSPRTHLTDPTARPLP